MQHAHGRTTGPIEHTGASVALMPTEEDARRLRLAGGEPTEELHLTLYFLGKAADWPEHDRMDVVNSVMDVAPELGPVTARAFGVNHWNGDGEAPCWVLGVGDIRDSEETRLTDVYEAVSDALEDGHRDTDFPEQHAPWVPHISMAYTGDLSLAAELQKRLGEVTFDRIRITFAGEYTDVPLGASLTAAAPPLRRNPRPAELAAHTDFVRMQQDWESAVDAVLTDLQPIRDAQREQLSSQVAMAAELDDLDLLNSLSVDDEALYAVLIGHMTAAANEAGRAQQKEAEEQGVDVPDWTLSPGVTAAVGLDLLRSVARVTARVMNTAFVQSAIRRALALVGRPAVTPEQAAADVSEHLASLSGASDRDSVGGAVTSAQNEGRRTVLSVAPPASYYESSEILDKSVCKPCRQVDGTRYTTLPDATRAYPSGGYQDCLGGPRCRGTIVAVWNEPEE